MLTKNYRSIYGLSSSVIITLVLFVMLAEADRGQLESNVHRTQAATDQVRERWCYHCDTMDGGERCVDVLTDNRSEHHIKCNDDKRCMVRRISLITSTENSTSSPKLWLLQRTCVKLCEPGCIMIGERTKLYACTTCCELDFCNSGSGTESYIHNDCVQQLNTSVLITLTLKLIINYVMTE